MAYKLTGHNFITKIPSMSEPERRELTKNDLLTLIHQASTLNLHKVTRHRKFRQLETMSGGVRTQGVYNEAEVKRELLIVRLNLSFLPNEINCDNPYFHYFERCLGYFRSSVFLFTSILAFTINVSFWKNFGRF